MKYSNAKSKLDKLAQKSYSEFYRHPEYEAAVTHWLQSPQYEYPFFPENFLSDCLRLFTRKKESHKNKKLIAEEEVYYQPQLSFGYEDIPFPPPKNPNFTFIDLFAGIGGFRIAFQRLGGKCVFSSEWDKYAQKTYEANFGEVPFGDIREIDEKTIPEHDVLCAGFPCQPFSLAGVSKKNSLGKKHGFEDETQGTLFFNIAKVLECKKPKAFFLENVKNLLRHDKGKTFAVIEKTLKELGYVFNYKIVDAGAWVPQHRERIFLVGFNPDKVNISQKEILIPTTPQKSYRYPELKNLINDNVEGFTIGPGTWETLKRHKQHHAKNGNGFGYSLLTFPIKNGQVTRTISARYHKDGAEILIEQKNNRPRRLTIEEAMQLQGYNPKKFVFPVSKTQAYRQIGNSIAIPAVTDTAKEIAQFIKK